MIVNAGFQGIIVINYLNKALFYLFFLLMFALLYKILII